MHKLKPVIDTAQHAGMVVSSTGSRQRYKVARWAPVDSRLPTVAIGNSSRWPGATVAKSWAKLKPPVSVSCGAILQVATATPTPRVE